MKNKLTFLGIETSCDETSAAIVQADRNNNSSVLSNIISSQAKKHEKFGGVVPELAARAHIENTEFVIKDAIQKSKINLKDIDGVAATAGPGLIVSLHVGLNIGKSIACSIKKPFLAINHLEGHALSPGLDKKIEYPYLLLLISGGHSQFLIVKDVGSYQQLGTTIDDAVGEAFDKTAKILELKYPGGPNVEKFAKGGDKKYFKLPQPIINRGGCNLSFAGLKTAVMHQAKNISKDKKLKKNLAASFQYTINEILRKKTLIAMKDFREKIKKKNPDFVIAGGVAANKTIRNNLKSVCKEKEFNANFPPVEYCGDNAAMIAWAGIQRFKKNKNDLLLVPAKSRWPLDLEAPFMKGPGLKF